MTTHPTRRLALLSAALLSACASNNTAQRPSAEAAQPTAARAERPAYPATRREEAFDELHGTKVPDPYRWLEDVKSPEVQAWMKAQDDLARAELAKLPRRAGIAARLRELLYLDRLGSPKKRGARVFWTKQTATQEKYAVYYREASGGPEKLLLDPNTWSTDGSIALGGYSISWDGKRVAYAEKKNNADEGVIKVLDIDSMKLLEADTIRGVRYSGAQWSAQNDGFYYTWTPSDPSIHPSQRQGFAEVRFHKLGGDPKSDRVIREKLGDPRKLQSVWPSKDGHWLVHVVSHGSAGSQDLYIRDLRKPDAPWVTVVEGVKAHYAADVWADKIYVWTDEGHSRGHVYVADAESPARAQWRELIKEHPADVLRGINVVGGKIAAAYLQDVATRIEVRELDGTLLREQKLPGRGSASNLIGEEDDDEAYFSYTSFTTPPEIHKVSVKSGETSLYFRLKAPVDPATVESKQVFFASKDGTRVPLWVMHKKGLQLDGTAPALLYGYGGFRSAMTPGFSAPAFAWVEQGGVYAVANLRGGSEYGEKWHQDGMLGKKQNVFDDFIGAGEWLVKEKYTSPGRLAVRGGSNGGLLVGAAMVQRPDLFGVVLCSVPLLDMVRFPKFGVANFWVAEYGNPDDAQAFQWLHAYSPYHRVKEGTRYPAMLMLSADSDDRVDPMHARKFSALVQHASTGGPALLRIERNAGHGGADLLKATVEKTADELAFALAHAGAAR